MKLPQVQASTIDEMVGESPFSNGARDADALFDLQPELVKVATALVTTHTEAELVSFIGGMAFACRALQLELSKIQ